MDRSHFAEAVRLNSTVTALPNPIGTRWERPLAIEQKHAGKKHREACKDLRKMGDEFPEGGHTRRYDVDRQYREQTIAHPMTRILLYYPIGPTPKGGVAIPGPITAHGIEYINSRPRPEYAEDRTRAAAISR